MVIVEGKKEDAAKELKKIFEYDRPFIDRMLGIDPTGYKYIDYIKKQLGRIIPELAGARGGLNVSQQEAINNTLSSVIPWFHHNQNKITEDDVWNAESLFRNQVGHVDNIENIAKNPKDINQYTNPDFIRTLMNVVDSRKTEREIEREAKSQAKKIYEDNDVLVVKPLSFASSCYYGANTKWCTTTKGSSSYFEKYLREGQLYYFINKKNGIKRALFVKTKPKGYEIYTSTDHETTLEDLKSLFPEQENLIEDLIGVEHFVKKLIEYSRFQINYRELMDADELIYRMYENEPRGLTRIVFEFKDDSDFFDMLDLDDDDRWFVNMIFGYYSDYTFYDSYSADDDWENGYGVLSELNDENKEILKKISNVILSGSEFDLRNDEFVTKFSKQLRDLFPDEVEQMIYDYATEVNDEMQRVSKESVSREINTVMEDSGFEIVNDFYKFETTVGHLVMLAYKYRLFRADLRTLFDKAIRSSTYYQIGGWYENTYEFRNQDQFDTESYNRNIGIQLEKIIEELEDEENPISEYMEYRNRILSKFELNKWYKLPKDDTINFKIENIDRDTRLIQVRVEKQFEGQKTFKLTEEQFYNLLYQPELFDLFGKE